MIDIRTLKSGDIIQFIDPLQGEIFMVLNEELNSILQNHKVTAKGRNHFISLKTSSVISIDPKQLINATVIKYNRSFISVKITGEGKLAVVKAVKELTGLGLKEAKDYMDENHLVCKDLAGEISHFEIIVKDICPLDYSLKTKEIDYAIIEKI